MASINVSWSAIQAYASSVRSAEGLTTTKSDLSELTAIAQGIAAAFNNISGKYIGDISGNLIGNMSSGTVTPSGFVAGPIVYGGPGGTLAQDTHAVWDDAAKTAKLTQDNLGAFFPPITAPPVAIQMYTPQPADVSNTHRSAPGFEWITRTYDDMAVVANQHFYLFARGNPDLGSHLICGYKDTDGANFTEAWAVYANNNMEIYTSDLIVFSNNAGFIHHVNINQGLDITGLLWIHETGDNIPTAKWERTAAVTFTNRAWNTFLDSDGTLALKDVTANQVRTRWKLTGDFSIDEGELYWDHTKLALGIGTITPLSAYAGFSGEHITRTGTGGTMMAVTQTGDFFPYFILARTAASTYTVREWQSYIDSTGSYILNDATAPAIRWSMDTSGYGWDRVGARVGAAATDSVDPILGSETDVWKASRGSTILAYDDYAAGTAGWLALTRSSIKSYWVVSTTGSVIGTFSNHPFKLIVNDTPYITIATTGITTTRTITPETTTTYDLGSSSLRWSTIYGGTLNGNFTSGRVLFSGSSGEVTSDSTFLWNNSGKQLTIAGASIANDGTENWVKVTGTMPTSPSATVNANDFSITSSGSAAQTSRAFRIRFLAGYTGSSQATGLRVSNQVAGTGTTILNAGTNSEPTANEAVIGQTSVTTTGSNMGGWFSADGGDQSIGALGQSLVAKNSATNIGIAGFGLNTGTTPIQIGGYFGLQSSTPTFASGALVCDNGSTTSPILLVRDNGTTTFIVDDGGKLGFFGATSQTQQTSGANLTNNVTSGGTNDTIANFTDLTTYANDAATIRNDIYQLARKLKQINDGLRTYGLFT